jgi:NAD(P)H-dependent FMN reductase
MTGVVEDRMTDAHLRWEIAMIKIALIIGSTRPNRFADTPAKWILEGAKAYSDFEITVLDLREYKLPFFGDEATPEMTASETWREKIAEFDGFIMTAAEYNHAPTATLKNALDSAFHEWNNKPVSFVGYGGVGGARAIEQLRQIAVELQMAPIKNAVHINMEPFIGVMREGKTLDNYEYLVNSREAMFTQLLWWAKALKAAREPAVEKAEQAADVEELIEEEVEA